MIGRTEQRPLRVQRVRLKTFLDLATSTECVRGLTLWT